MRVHSFLSFPKAQPASHHHPGVRFGELVNLTVTRTQTYTTDGRTRRTDGPKLRRGEGNEFDKEKLVLDVFKAHAEYPSEKLEAMWDYKSYVMDAVDGGVRRRQRLQAPPPEGRRRLAGGVKKGLCSCTMCESVRSVQSLPSVWGRWEAGIDYSHSRRLVVSALQCPAYPSYKLELQEVVDHR